MHCGIEPYNVHSAMPLPPLASLSTNVAINRDAETDAEQADPRCLWRAMHICTCTIIDAVADRRF